MEVVNKPTEPVQNYNVISSFIFNPIAIIILLLLLTMVACKSSKHAKCDAYSSVSKTSQK